MESLSTILDIARNERLYPYTHEMDRLHEPETIVKGRNILMFSSNNYLGLLNDSRVIAAAANGLEKWGIGTETFGLLGGRSEIQKQLETRIADFKKKDACLTFSTGFLANSGTIPAIAEVRDPSLLMLGDSVSNGNGITVFSDECNHVSAMAGIRMSGAAKEIFKHRDVADLKRKLGKHSKQQRKLIITEGVFGMEGDIAPLPDILSVAKKYNAMVYLDDAHATGILGKDGRGVEDYYGIERGVDIVVGTFAKGFGGVGGFVVGSRALIDYLRVSANTYIFSAPIAPPVVCGLIKAIEIVENEPWRRKKLLENAKYVREALLDMGLNICGSQSQIIPILIGDESKTYAAAQMLSSHGIIVPTTMWPAVPAGKARLRISVMHNHAREQLNYLISVMGKFKHRILDRQTTYT